MSVLPLTFVICSLTLVEVGHTFFLSEIMFIYSFFYYIISYITLHMFHFFYIYFHYFFILYCFILFYFILFYFVLFYFIYFYFYFILSYFILFHFISSYSISFILLPSSASTFSPVESWVSLIPTWSSHPPSHPPPPPPPPVKVYFWALAIVISTVEHSRQLQHKLGSHKLVFS